MGILAAMCCLSGPGNLASLFGTPRATTHKLLARVYTRLKEQRPYDVRRLPPLAPITHRRRNPLGFS
ncbi:MAG TPA: hypothetical protein VFX49_16655 [Chloroflexota bacterium]|nr:hypothetical protein [Chloroflexota bacterium]